MSIFDQPAVLLEFESSEAKAHFMNVCNKNILLLHETSPRARIWSCSYVVIFCFISCNILSTLKMMSIFATLRKKTISWLICLFQPPGANVPKIGPPITAMLKVACTDSETANKLLTSCIHVNDHLINVHKDIWIPICCIKCQEYGHTWDMYIGIEKCANCTSEFYSTDQCELVEWAIAAWHVQVLSGLIGSYLKWHE